MELIKMLIRIAIMVSYFVAAAPFVTLYGLFFIGKPSKQEKIGIKFGNSVKWLGNKLSKHPFELEARQTTTTHS